MSRVYSVEFNHDLNVCTEQGWNLLRMLRDVDVESETNTEGLFFEPSTGILMLRPRQMEAGWWKNPNAEDDRDVPTVGVPGKWEEVPYGDPLTGLGKLYQTKHGFDQMSSLVIANEAVITVEGGVQLHPILITYEPFLPNQPVHLSYFHFSRHGVTLEDYVGLRFGDFFLRIRNNGYMFLYWSDDGSFDAGSMHLRKIFAQKGATGGKPGVGKITSVNTPPAVSICEVIVIPMAGGHIYIRAGVPGGGQFEGIYTHPEARIDQYGIWQITPSASVVVYTNILDNKQIRCKISKVGFPSTGVWTDRMFDIGYPPTVEPAIFKFWGKTHEEASMTLTLNDDNGNPFSPDGIKRKINANLSMTCGATNLFTPFVFGYGIRVLPKVELQKRKSIILSEDYITHISIRESDEMDERGITIKFKDEGKGREGEGFTALRKMAEVHGRLLIDGEPYMMCMFQEPSVQLGDRLDFVEMQGVEYGGFILNEKRWMNAGTYGGLTHPEAVAAALQDCGWTSLVTQNDIVELPEMKTVGVDTEGEQSETKGQPVFGDPVIEFFEWISKEFSGWRLWHRADDTWEYLPKSVPTEAVVTFYKEQTIRSLDQLYPWVSKPGPVLSYLPPECNRLLVFGKDDAGIPIAYAKEDPASFSNSTAKNYLGRWKQVMIIDASLNTEAAVKAVGDNLFSRMSKRTVVATWKGPFIPSLKPGDGVALEGISGIWRLCSIEAEAQNFRAMELGPSTTYTAELVVK